jgi:acetate kinase
MGFTALDGLPMGTRTGQIDPGVLLYLLEAKKMSVADLTDLLYRKSGLLGLSGVSNDLRDLEASDNPHAREAIDFFVYRIGREIGSLAAAMGGIDGLVFTAGIGEHAPAIRAAVAKGAGWLGFTLDANANDHCREGRISLASSKEIWVIPTDEEMMIATQCAAFLQNRDLKI